MTVIMLHISFYLIKFLVVLKPTIEIHLIDLFQLKVAGSPFSTSTIGDSDHTILGNDAQNFNIQNFG